jgi:hypothetical protein
MGQDHQFERDRKGNLAATEIHSRDGRWLALLRVDRALSGPGQWLVVALTEGSARLTVGQRLLSQGGFDAVATNSGDLFAIPGLLNKPIAASLMRNVDMIGRQPVLMALDHHRVGTLDMPRI